MNDAFLSGALVAWAVTYFSIGLFFALGNMWAGKDREYVLFGLFVSSLAVMDVGFALVFWPSGAPPGMLGNRIAVTGGLGAALFQLQFALRYSGRALPWNMRASSAGAIVLLVWLWLVPWPQEEAGEGGTVMLLQRVPALGWAFSLLALAAIVLTLALLFDSYRRGKREALLLLAAAGVVGVSALHDLLVVHTPGGGPRQFASPYVLWVYVVAMAATLLIRYRGAEGRLAEAASHLRARTEELRRSHAELEKVQSELVRKEQLAAVGELAASIAHEVRNPLAVIVNANAGLRRRTVSEDDRETLLSIIEEETERLNRLVAELLRYARPVAAKRSAVSLRELCLEVRKGAPPEHQVVVQIDDEPSLDTVWVDPGLFRLVLDNLVANACQAMRSGGDVVIRVRADRLEDGRQAVAVDVIDGGHGMESPVLQRALHPFFTTRPSGTGLGLPIVQRIIEAHGGDLRLSSRPGAGTTATLRVPRARPNELLAAEASQPAEPPVVEEGSDRVET